MKPFKVCQITLLILFVFSTKVQCSEMITIPAGTFTMGSMEGELAESPPHQVTVSSFKIDRNEVTHRQFAYFVKSRSYVTDVERSGKGWHWSREMRWHQLKGANWRHPFGPKTSNTHMDTHPVVQVSWNDARAYCVWAGKRLPTEAEWEFTARGKTSRIYAWGDSPPHADHHSHASYGSDTCCQASSIDGYLYTAPVGSFPTGHTDLGVEDLTGNVWEWVEDAYDAAYYKKSQRRNPINTTFTGQRVIRGGGWGNNPWGLRSTLRHANPPDYGLSMVGFRCAKS